MDTPREHIEQIRTQKFSIGREDNPLFEDLHYSVKHLSAELYTKDVHFLMELLQNAEDNDYPAEVEPSSEFVITNRDITGVGAPATLLVFNNEKGFTSNNIESICSVGRSTKKGKRQGGYIGEKGIGFKSVFLVSRQPYIFSGGYQIRFNEVPPPDTKIGYIVPEWVDDKPSIQDILEVYGGKNLAELPNTVIILPLRHEKVEAVKQQLASIHPEVILFLTKLKKFSVREDSQKRVNTISVSKEIAFRSVTDEQSESFILHLSAQENDKSNGECSYYMWRQRFPVKTENRVEGREEVDNWVITLAFPRDERVTTTRNKISAGIYAFLPTEMVTGFPFIIQADFLLVSSRETIRWDDKWNKGILDCIPSAFCSAFLFLVKSEESGPASSMSYCFDKYLPIHPPSYAQLGGVRDAIQERLSTEEIIFCELQNAYCTPLQARRIVSSFRDILQKSTEEGMEKPNALWSTGVFIIHSCMDNLVSLKFLGVQYVTYDWYSICIANTSGWVHGFSEDLYVQLLCFVAEYWRERGIRANLQYFDLFKYHNEDCFCNVAWTSLCDISASCENSVYFSNRVEDIEWLIRWNKELRSMQAPYKFVPIATVRAMKNLGACRWPSLQQWLKDHAKIREFSISNFIKGLLEEVNVFTNKDFVVRVAQFLHFTSANNFIHSKQMQCFCSTLPVVSDSGCIVHKGRTKLIPAAIGKWAKLIGNNRWPAQEAVILSNDYLQLPSCAVGLRGGGPKSLEYFFTNGLRAVDIPDIKPPVVAGFPFSIGQEEAIILLQWIQHLIVTSDGSLPNEFKRIVMEGKWLKTHMGYQSPTMSFLLDDEWKYGGLQLNDLSFIDSTFYRNSMSGFKTTLEHIGVVVKFGNGCDIVAKHLTMHTDLKAITRLYKYLHRFKWTPNQDDTVKIWIPHDGGFGGVWKDTERCVIHDDTDIFSDKLQVLEEVYEDEVLPFFSKHLGVRVHPKIEDYCNLWLTWSSTEHPVTESECCSLWKNILKNWRLFSSTIETNMGARGLTFPSYTNGGRIQFSGPNETFIPDNLTLAELFKRNSARIKFAWHPNPSNAEVPLDLLFSMYKSLGARNISEAARKNEVSISNEITLHKLEAGEGLFTKGLYRIVLAYLAFPSFKLPVYKRHQIVRTLLRCPAYETSESFTVSYTLPLIAEDGMEENIVATAPSFVRWEKVNNRILIHKSDPHDEKARLSSATEFAEVVSNGLLYEQLHLVPGLSEILQIGCILGFDDEVVNEILQHENFQLFKEDEGLLQSVELFASGSDDGRPAHMQDKCCLS